MRWQRAIGGVLQRGFVFLYRPFRPWVIIREMYSLLRSQIGIEVMNELRPRGAWARWVLQDSFKFQKRFFRRTRRDRDLQFRGPPGLGQNAMAWCGKLESCFFRVKTFFLCSGDYGLRRPQGQQRSHGKKRRCRESRTLDLYCSHDNVKLDYTSDCAAEELRW